jgi:glutathionylspermidine synthase
VKGNIQLLKVPEHDYSDYRYEVIFEAYKWDPQVEDANTVSEYVAVLDEHAVEELTNLAEQLAVETTAMELELLDNLEYAKELGLPRSMCRGMKKAKDYQKEKHVRLMRFDFHPTDQGWQISEVNSDVPGGFAESSILPEIAARFFPDTEPSENFGRHLYQGFEKRIQPGSTIGFVHATSYADDRQVMQFMGDYFESKGYRSVYLAPDDVKFEQKQAYSVLEDQPQCLSGIIRFFPLEWMPRLPFSADWQGYYSTTTPSCNHPVAMLTQPKSLPLIWDKLNVECPTWRKLLPETKKAYELSYEESDFIYKPVFGRVGGDITIKEATSEKEFKRIKKEALKRKKEWVVQKRFNSQPIKTDDGKEFHLCIGVFVVDGVFSGFYGRISPYARIDEKAKDIPIIVRKSDI